MTARTILTAALLTLASGAAWGQPTMQTWTTNAPDLLELHRHPTFGWTANVSPIYIPAFNACFPVASAFCREALHSLPRPSPDTQRNAETDDAR